jgi:membrane protein YqaA with SNARE-associated domain
MGTHGTTLKRTTTAGLGVSALLLWVFIFAAGILLDSKPYREALRSPEKTHETARGASDVVASPAVLDAGLPGVAAALPSYPVDAATFGRAVVLFTPLNAAILTLLAAMVGGCASWLAHHGKAVPDLLTPQEKQHYQRRLDYLQENPVTATFRGFAVYLAVIAGVYIIGGDPFDQATPSQYVRFAGSVSLLAFMVGYDPMKLQDLLDGLPGPGKKS